MRIPLVLAAVAFLCATATAAPPAAEKSGSDQTAAALRTRLSEKFPGVKIQDLGPSPVPGVYEFTANGDVMYISADGRYLLDAQIMDIDTRVNVTEAKRAVERKKALAQLDEKQMIVFAPASYKYTLTVFTDVDCGYCQKLHSEMAQINKLGVRVRYLAYPRSGPGTESWHKMESVWCAKDRKDAMTRAKAGESVAPQKNCGSTPIRAQYELGESLGVKGTPAVFTDSGQQIGGYIPADRLLEVLKQQG
ncbi:MAG: DsbC family protein [Steroidobacteraceae bacterium]